MRYFVFYDGEIIEQFGTYQGAAGYVLQHSDNCCTGETQKDYIIMLQCSQGVFHAGERERILLDTCEFSQLRKAKADSEDESYQQYLYKD